MPPRTAATLTRLEDRRKRVAEMYLAGQSQYDIARVIGIDRSVISTDLKAIRAAWLERSVMDFGQRQAEELAKIDWLEKDAREALERSKAVAVETTHETSTDDTNKIKVTRKEKHRDGDDCHRARIAWCIEMRCKILGIPSQVPPPPAAPVVVVMSPAVFAAALALEEAIANDSQSSRPLSLGAGATRSPVVPVGAAPSDHSKVSDDDDGGATQAR